MGIMLGGWWSYEVLGWGGYWAWDPVENASFLPWLTAIAAVHSAIVLERKGTLKAWTVVLVLITFLLTILGTFLTRSGVVNSVHSFTQSPIGPAFLAFLGLALLFVVALLTLRIDKLAGAPGSRDAARARGRVLRQQPAAGGAHVHGADRHAPPGLRRVGARHQGERRRALLQPDGGAAVPRRCCS